MKWYDSFTVMKTSNVQKKKEYMCSNKFTILYKGKILNACVSLNLSFLKILRLEKFRVDQMACEM